MTLARKQDIPIRVLYLIDCKVCGQAVWPDEEFCTRAEAEEARSVHIQEHKEGQWT